jgi:MFS family permease
VSVHLSCKSASPPILDQILTKHFSGAIGLFISVYISDRFHERSLVICGSMLVALIGFIVLTVSSNNALRYGFLHICLAGASNISPLMAAWLTDNTPDSGTRSIIIGINGYSNLAGVIAGQLFKTKYAPSYQYPLKVTMVLVIIGMVGFGSLRVVYMWTNRSRARKVENWTADDFETERRNSERRGDQKLSFVYGY